MEGNIDLRIDSIRDIEFFLVAVGHVNPAQVGVKIEGKDMVAYGDSKTVRLVTEFKSVYNYETESPELLMKYVNEMTFYIDNFHDVLRLENNRYIFDKSLGRFLLDIVIPTVRGILFVKTAGTSLAKFYLPLIQADKIIQ